MNGGRYCKSTRDSQLCLRLWEKYAPEWSNDERTLSAHTRVLQHRGVHVDVAALDQGIEKLKKVREQAEVLIPWVGKSATLSLKAVREHCSVVGIPAPASMAKDNEECLAWEDEFSKSYPWIDALRTFRSSNFMLRKLEAIKTRIRPDGTIPVYLKFFGASTGRWSGDAGVNLQNLPRGEMFGVNLRPMFVPAKGKKFVIVDLSQIEPRVLSWLANDKTMLERLSKGEPLYEAHARNSMKWSGGELKTENPDLYRLAKARVLGLGYGCGAQKFRLIAEVMAGLTLTEVEAKTIVADWRNSNPAITEYWKRLGLQLVLAKDNKRDLEFKLPSGRKMIWKKPRPESSDSNRIVVDVAGRKSFVWGGKLVENICQAVARDCFADHLLKIEAAGYPVTWHVHDECIVEVDADKAEEALTAITKIMSVSPAWAADLPLAAEGGVHSHYAK